MDTQRICDAFSEGLSDGSLNKPKAKQENFNLQEAYDYGYGKTNVIKPETNGGNNVA